MSTADPASEDPAGAWSGATCRNCGAGLEGRYCSACGQAAAQSDQLWDLIREWFQRLFSTEPVLWGTLRLLVWNPAELTREWWAGRRARLMSPVRTLFSVLVVSSVVAVVWNTFSGKQTEAPRILMGFTYQAALVTVLLCLRVLPGLLPKPLRRTAYENATFALYECAFLGLLMLAAMTILLLGDLTPWLGALGGLLAPLLIPLLVGAAVVHGVVHLWKAFGLSLAGAVVRFLVLAALLVVGMAFASILFAATGLDAFWSPRAPEPGSFHRMAAG